MGKRNSSCDGCKHNGKYENGIKLGQSSPCLTCSRHYNDNFEPVEIQENECFCISCKKIVSAERVFRKKGSPSLGLCFDCY